MNKSMWGKNRQEPGFSGAQDLWGHQEEASQRFTRAQAWDRQGHMDEAKGSGRMGKSSGTVDSRGVASHQHTYFLSRTLPE